jgi:hypothetical protein
LPVEPGELRAEFTACSLILYTDWVILVLARYGTGKAVIGMSLVLVVLTFLVGVAVSALRERKRAAG